MLLRYRDNQFWKKFHDRHWRPRVPTVIRQPFKAFPFSEGSLLRTMKAYEEGLRGGDRRVGCLVSVGDVEGAPRRRLRELFREGSETLAQLEKDCARVFQERRFGLMIHGLQAVHPEIWDAITAFLQDAHPWIDFPVARAFLDLFYGNYSSTFTGLHKDTQEIFAFVVRGEKRMLAWPFDYFPSRVKGVSPADRYFQKRLAVDYRKYRKDAIVLDARAGDVFYWPSDYWHIAEPKPPRHSAMISLGIFRPDQALSPRSRFRTPRSQKMREMTGGPDAARQLRWLTGFGFELGGPIAESFPHGREAPGKIEVRKKKSSLVLWSVDVSRHRILVSSNGHSATFPHSSRLLMLLDRIARGEPVSLDSAACGGRSTIFETQWNKQAKLETRKVVSRREVGGLLARWLARVGAVRGE